MCFTSSGDGPIIAPVNISDHMTDAGTQPVPGKSQYVRGGNIFTCPVCGWKESSHGFSFYSFFEDACKEHMKTHRQEGGEHNG